MIIRKAIQKDIPRLHELLMQVLDVHANKRPDIFKANTTKYTDLELKELIQDETRPIFVATDENDYVLGYAFCIHQQFKDSNNLQDIKTLYIDDLCVDKTCHHQHIGSKLYEHVYQYAQECDCYNITLNVWACNEEAYEFYKRCHLEVQKIGLEAILPPRK